MIKVFAHPASTCSRKVLITLAETKTPHEFILVDFAKGEHKAPAHMARQPFGQVPTINDDGFELYESRAIIRYLNDKAGGSLVPSNPQQRALMDQWMSIESANFTPHAMKFVYQHIFGRPQSAEAFAAAEVGINVALAVMEKQLTATEYVVASGFGLADICFMPYVGYSMLTPAKEIIANYPHVMAWWNRCSERASWRTVSSN